MPPIPLQNILENLKQSLNKIDEKWGEESSAPNTEASEEVLKNMEKSLGWKLPEDYRLFLSLHDG